MKPKILAFDWETTGLLPHNGDRGFAIAFCDEEENTYYWEWFVNPKTREVRYTKQWPQHLQEYLADPTIIKVGHNVKFDMYMAEKAGLKIAGEFNDTIIAARCCYSLEPTYGLKALASKYLDMDNEDEKELQDQTIRSRIIAKKLGYKIGEKVQEDYWLTSIPELSPRNDLVRTYCIQDTIRTMRLWKFYSEGMKQLEVYHSYLEELHTMKTLIDMEKRGVKISLDESRNKLYECVHKEIGLLNDIRKEVGWAINPGSGQQLAKATLELGIDIKERTKSSKTFPNGQVSTAAKTLKKYKHEHPFIDMLLRHSGACTGKQYFHNYIKHAVNNGTGENIIHPNFKQGNTKTFRFSCSDPNLQNVANDETSSGEYVVNGRSAFLPRNGYIWVCIDYKQLELRIFADRAQEQTLLGAFKNGRDPHNETREAVPYLAGKPRRIGRKLSKNTNFTIIFCGGPKVLNEKYGIPIGEAQKIMSQYHEAFPGIRRYQNWIGTKGKLQGYITNAFDRKLSVDPAFAYRAASYVVQSSAADLMKLGMNKCHAFLKKEKLDTHIVLSIHDEIVFEMSKSDFDIDLIKKLKELMEDHEGRFCIPTTCDVDIVKERWSKKRVFTL